MDQIEMLRKIDPAEIVASLNESLLVLNDRLEVIFANDTFLETFGVDRDATLNRPLAELGSGQWARAGLTSALEAVKAGGPPLKGYLIDAQFPVIGRRVMRLNARMTRPADGGAPQLLVAFEDVTVETDLEHALDRQRRISKGVIDTLREPFLVLDENLVVKTASRSFYQKFRVEEHQTIGLPLVELGNGQWNIPALVELLTNVIPDNITVENYEITHDFETIGQRVMNLNACKIFREGNNSRTILLALEDLTDRRQLEAEREAALAQANRLLVELNHRVMNSLSMIGSVIALEARNLTDVECRAAFDRMRARIGAVAALYRNLSHAGSIDTVDGEKYLSALLEGVVAANQRRGLKLELDVTGVSVPLSTRLAVPLGLIINELATNSFKYAFTDRENGVLGLRMELAQEVLKLTVWDNGVGIDADARVDSGLGQKLTSAFCRQIDATLERESGANGTSHVLSVPLRPTFDELSPASAAG